MNAEQIRAQLTAALSPLQLELQDDGAQHAGHAHAGAGHFSVRIVSRAFAGQPRLARHRLVYAALGDLLGNGVHALSIRALAPDETD